MLVREGFTLAQRYLRMEISMQAAPPAPVWPIGVTARPFVAGQDERAVFDLMRQHSRRATTTISHSRNGVVRRSRQRGLTHPCGPSLTTARDWLAQWSAVRIPTTAA